jgi:RES domain-containing protein
VNVILPSDHRGFVRVEGTFFRSVDARHQAAVLDGSVAAGRYSAPGGRALYLSASVEGVQAAMLAHQRPDDPPRVVVSLQVRADRVFDLRDEARCTEVGINMREATAPWQQDVRNGRAPPSWGVARRLREIGARGLIDPSRKAPGLWHLVLFEWNGDGHSFVEIAD